MSELTREKNQWTSSLHSSKLLHYWKLTIRWFSVTFRILFRSEEFYPAAEMQLVYSTAPPPADRVQLKFVLPPKFQRIYFCFNLTAKFLHVYIFSIYYTFISGEFDNRWSGSKVSSLIILVLCVCVCDLFLDLKFERLTLKFLVATQTGVKLGSKTFVLKTR